MRELAPGVHMLGAKKGGRVRAYLIETNGELSLVDTLFENDARGVLDAIRQLGHKPSDLKRIVLTHAHRSHLGGLAALKRETGAAVLAHEWEADIISGDRPAQSVGLKPTAPFRTYPFQVGIFLNRPKHRPVPIDESVGDGDAVGPLQVLYVPGHSPGHLAFSWAERGLLLSGDAIATWPRFEAGWPAFTLNPDRARRVDPAHGRARRAHRRRRPRRPDHGRRRRQGSRPRRTGVGSSRDADDFPYLLYEDVASMLDWLTRAFGFTEKLRFAGEDGTVNHAEMEVAGGSIMLGDPGDDYRSPKNGGGWPAQIQVYVDDLERALRAGEGGGRGDPARARSTCRTATARYDAYDAEGHSGCSRRTSATCRRRSWGATESA